MKNQRYLVNTLFENLGKAAKKEDLKSAICPDLDAKTFGKLFLRASPKPIFRAKDTVCLQLLS